MSAEWRGCLGGVYAVSDKGGVRRELGGKGARAGRLCRTSKHHSGYVHTNVCCGGRQRRIAVHILMAEAFLGPRPFGKECNHKDGVKGKMSFLTSNTSPTERTCYTRCVLGCDGTRMG